MNRFFALVRADLNSPVPYCLWVVLTIAVSIAGPFGSYAIVPFTGRLLFWAPTLAATILIGILVRSFLQGVVGLQDPRSLTTGVGLIMCLIIAQPMLAIVHALYGATGVDLPGFWEMCGFIFSLSLGVGAFRYLLAGPGRALAAGAPAVITEGDGRRPASPEGPGHSAGAQPRLLLRLPPQARGPLQALSVRDHYVDVTTSAARSTVLMRLSDAIAETAGVDGDQIHRSHWVAWAAVRATEQTGTRLSVVMVDGSRLPVSRNHRPKLVARGLLDPRGIGITFTQGPVTTARASAANRPSKARSALESPPA